MDARTVDQDFGRLGHMFDETRAAPRLDASQFAWEFLRRNPAYRADFARLSSGAEAALPERWGLRFAIDPNVAAPRADIFWRPEAAPGIVIPLAPAPAADARAIPLPAPSGPVRVADDGSHMRLLHGLQLLLKGDRDRAQCVVVQLAFDQHFRLRLAAAETLYRIVRGGGAPARLSEAQRARLGRALVALDAAERRETYREIAARLFGAKEAEREDWRTSSTRATTIRLVEMGRRLMRGGYLELLRGAS